MTLLVLAHLLSLLVGLWAIATGTPRVLALYAASQVVFIAFFAGVLPLVPATICDQLLIAAAIVAYVRRQKPVPITLM